MPTLRSILQPSFAGDAVTGVFRAEGGRWIAGSAFCILALGCGKAPEPESESETPAQLEPSAAVSEGMDDQEVETFLTELLPPTEPEVNPLVEQAEAIQDRYPTKNAKELLEVPEVKESLQVALKRLGDRPELLKLLESNVDLAAQMSGLTTEKGRANLDLDVTQYDRGRTTAMLSSVLSEDPRQVVGFVANEIGEALPDLMFSEGNRAPNGVAIVPKNPPPGNPDSQP